MLPQNPSQLTKLEMKHLRILHYNNLWNPFKQTTGLNIYNHSTQHVTNSALTTRSYLKDLQIVISKKLQHLFLQIAHLQHQGIQKTKNLLRQKVWWPTLNQDVEELIKHCHSSKVSTPPKSHSQQLQLPETPQRNWEKLAPYLKGPVPSRESILVINDYK